MRLLVSSLLFCTIAGQGVMNMGTARADERVAAIAGQSLDVTADKLDVNIAQGTAVLEGGVRVVMGGLQIDCPKLDLRYDAAPQVKWARASGGVTAQIDGIVAKANALELDVAKRQVNLAGEVRLSRGKGWLEAARATINLTTQKVSLEGVRGQIPVETP